MRSACLALLCLFACFAMLWGLKTQQLSYTPLAYLSGSSSAMGGSLLVLNACESTTATVSGALPGEPVEWSTSDGSDRIGLGLNVHADVTSANTVTIKECAILAVTPASKVFNVRVLP